MLSTPLPLLFAPALLLFELAQIFVAERFLGVKQIQKGIDPRTHDMSELLAFTWTLGIIASWLWMFIMLGLGIGKGQIACMIAISLVGYAVRRSCRMKWVLVTLTFEGAIRMGMYASLISYAWRAQAN